MSRPLPGFAPGSTLWLIVHDIRLAWRGSSGQVNNAKASAPKTDGIFRYFGFILYAGYALLTGWVASLVAPALERVEPHIATMPGAAAFWLAVGTLGVLTLMLSMTISLTITAFYDRRDLDLLLSSPLSPRRILSARCLAIAVNSGLLFIGIVLPAAITFAVLAHPRWLSIIFVLMSLSLLAATIGLWTAMALFQWLGARKAKIVAQVFGAILGAVFFMAGQTQNLLPREERSAFWASLNAYGDLPMFAPGAWGRIPAQALLGDIGAGLLLFALGAAVFAASVSSLGRRFAANAAASQGTERHKQARDNQTGRFGAGPVISTMIKEARILWHDPALMSQLLMRLLYMLPLIFILWRQAGRADETVLITASATGVVFIGGQISGLIARVTLNSEDAVDLLNMAPSRARDVRMGKFWAAVAPTSVLIGLTCVGMAFLNPWVALWTGLFALASAFAAAAIIMWKGKPFKRASFRQGGGSSVVASLLAGLATSSFSSAAALAAIGWPLALVPLIIGGVIVGASQESISEPFKEA